MLSIGARILLLILGLGLTFGLGASVLVWWQFDQVFEREIRARVGLIAENLSRTTLGEVLAGNKLEARRTLLQVKAEHPEIEYVYLVDFDGRVFAHSFTQGFPAALLELDFSSAEATRKGLRLETEGGALHHSARPLIEGSRARVHIGTNEDFLHATLNRNIAQLVFVILLLAAAGCLAGFFVSRRIAAPLKGLAEAMRAYGAGAAPGQVPLLEGRGGGEELTVLRRAFQEMIEGRKNAEQSLRESEASLAEAQRIARLGSFEWDIVADKLVWSDEVFRILKLEPQEFEPTDERYMSFVHPDDRAAVEAETRAALAEGRPYDITLRLIASDGEVRIIHDQAEVECDEAGRPRRMRGAVHDITERARAEEELQKTLAQLQQAQRIAKLDAWFWDKRNDKVTFFSHGGTVHGVPVERLQGITEKEYNDTYMHPEDREWVEAAYADLPRKKQAIELEYRVLDAAGGARVVSEVGEAIFDEAGTYIGQFGILRDITERRQTEEHFRRYFEMPLVGSAIYAPDMTWIQVNDKLCGLLGYSREELTKLTWADVTHPDDLAENARLFDETLAGERDTYSMDKRFIRKTGEVLHATISVQCLRKPDGAPDYFILLVQDITERKEAEEALRESEASLINAQRIARLGNWDWNIVTGELHWSDEIYRIFGIEPQRFGATYDAFLESVHPDDRETVTQAVDAALTGAVPYSIDHRIVLPDGAVRTVHEQAEVTFDGSGTPIRMSGTVQDITESVRAAAALRDSEARLQYAQRVAAMGHWDWQAGEDRISFSPNIASLLGIAGADLPERHDGYLEFVHEDDREALKATVGRAFETSSAFTAEYRIVTPSGQTRHLSEIGEPKPGDSRTAGMFGTLQDITERKQAEEELRKALDQLRHAQRIAKLISWYWDAKKDERRVSGLVEMVLGIPAEALQGSSVGAFVEKLVHPEDRVRVLDAYATSISAREGVELEYRIDLPDGEPRFIHEVGEPVLDANGELIAQFGTFQDITERKRADEALRESEESFRQIAENINQVLYLYAPDLSRTLYVSPAYEEIYGLTCESLFADPTSFLEAVDPEHREWVAAAQARQAEGAYDVTYRLKRTDGSRRWVHDRAFPIRDRDGGTYRIVGIAEDVTEQRRAEEALKLINEQLEERVEQRTAELRAAQEELVRKERLAALGQLTGTVSHELRNPLGAMRTSIAAIKKLAPEDVPLLQSSVAIVDRSITRCDNIIGDLLDYSRVRPLERETTAIDGWLADLLDEYRLPEGVALDRQLATGAEAAIDRDRLRRALVNVVDNACQAVTGSGTDAEQGGAGRVTVSARREDGQVAIEIADTGPGIAAQALERVFEPLYSTKSFGVGLGLPLVKRITEQHDGTVEVESTPGEGTRFVLRLPASASQQRAAS